MDKPLSLPIKIVMAVAGEASLLLGPFLFLWPTGTEIYFAWTIGHPLTPIFMGAAYFASAVGVFYAIREKRWSVARTMIPGITLFSVLMTVATALHSGIFNWQHIIAWGWLITYVGVPPFILVLYPRFDRGFQPPSGTPPPRVFTVGMSVFARISLLIGLALFLAPGLSAPVWSWGLTPLTARVVGGWFIANATTQWVLSRQEAVETVRVGMVMKMVFAGLCLLGLLWQRAALDGSTVAVVFYVVYMGGLFGLSAFSWQKSFSSKTSQSIPAIQ